MKPMDCPAGYYCPPGTQSPTQHPCPTGTFRERPGALSAKDCRPCLAGQFCADSGDQCASLLDFITPLSCPFDTEVSALPIQDIAGPLDLKPHIKDTICDLDGPTGRKGKGTVRNRLEEDKDCVRVQTRHLQNSSFRCHGEGGLNAIM